MNASNLEWWACASAAWPTLPCSRGNQYVLIVTDPQATQRLERGEAFGENALLTISLTKPYAGGAGKPAMCYKVAAAVIEL